MNIRLIGLSLLAATFPACVVDKELGEEAGETEAATETEGGPADGTAGDTDGTASQSGGSPTGVGTETSPSTTVTASAGPDTDDSGSATAGEAICPDWSPPPFDCEPPGDVSLHVSEGPNAELEDVACTVTSLQSESPTDDRLTLDCGEDDYAILISTEPHAALPFAADQEVVLDATESFENVILSPSFVLRSTEGELLLAYINEIDLQPDLDISPVGLDTSRSGCPGSSVAEFCEGNGQILSQRIMLEFEGASAPVFDRTSAMVPAGAGEVLAIVAEAGEVVCWDEDCAGDDSGPFDHLHVLLVGQ